MKKFLLSVNLSFLLLTNLSAEVKKDELTYDSSKGWWWYEEKVIDEDGKEKTVKFNLSPKEKKELDEKKELNELLKELIKEQKASNKINIDILHRLEYAFPDVTPKETINKVTGEPCITNSEMNCFVMPVVAEAQQVPVLKDFISDPNPENSKKWLQWQATYFNHVTKISNGLRFAYLKGGREAYPTQTMFALGDNPANSYAEDFKASREARAILKLKDSIALLAFMGRTTDFEEFNKVHENFHNWNTSYLGELEKGFIFESQEAIDKFLAFVDGKFKDDYSVKEFWKTAKLYVKPELFKKYNIKMTPMLVIYYEDKESKTNISETIASGALSPNIVRKAIKNFLTYNEIIEEKELAAEVNWGSRDINIAEPFKEPNFKNVHKSYLGEDNE